MSETKIKPIKVVTGYARKTPAEILLEATAAYTGITSDLADYPNPTVDMVTFKGAIDILSSKITAALDGSKKAIAERNHQVDVVIKMMRQLGHYVEANCKDHMPTFLKSGFVALSTAKATAQSVSQFIRKITAGKNAGQFVVTLAAVPGAYSYELRGTPIGSGGTPGTPFTQPVGTTRPPALITGLTPGMAYAIQVRAVIESGYSDWSDSVTRICT